MAPPRLPPPPPLRFGPPEMTTPRKATSSKKHPTTTTPSKFKASGMKRKVTSKPSQPAVKRLISQNRQPLARKLESVSQKLKNKPLARKSLSKKKVAPRKALSQSSRKTFDGTISEAEHVKRHADSKRFCIRCDIYQHAKSYEACSWHDGQSWLKRGFDSRGVWGRLAGSLWRAAE